MSKLNKSFVYLYGWLDKDGVFIPKVGSMKQEPNNINSWCNTEFLNADIPGPFTIFAASHGRATSAVVVIGEYSGMRWKVQIRLHEFVNLIKQGKVRDGKLYTNLIGKRCGGSSLYFGEKED